MEDTPPLSRHAALRPLSREHMGGLVQARSLRRAAEGDAAWRRAAVEAFVTAWSAELSPHFEDEERLLLPLIDEPAMRARLLDEHRRLRDLAERCSGDPDSVARDPDLLRRLGTLLHDHIRWEERVLFEAIQRDHPVPLAGLEAEAARIEERRPGSRARGGDRRSAS